ncbi:LysR family transcriptional regulator [Pseudooceanicola spongiae]|uniref:LysR family transcriptional regulator n=1 Tax=Pseudooceanicola spongiae TaxID=2613965 RepID=A0A7L9WHA1_9RHOB|nr:LysR family transcriptional regulator [Pseudooceanicola spongiae]QOL79745.1 LysR family transcriptional regulator [Pseudooceanicola spongiae]
MDMLRAMASFVRVVDAGSLSAAGRDLGVSQSAISQQIAALEQLLKVRLIRRTTRQMALTDAGAEYYRKAQAILEAVQEAGEAAAGHAAALKGRLRIHAPVGFGQSYIADVAIAFQKSHPGVIVELILDDRFIDLTADAVDIAIRFGNLASSGLVVRRLGRMRRILVASPAYIAENGHPDDATMLTHHVQVRFNGAPERDAIPLIGPDGPLEVPVRTVFMANNAFALTKALVAGVGLGGAQLPLVQTELESGELVRLMPDFEYAPLDVHAVYPSGHFIPQKVSAFVLYLQQATKGVW